jgi:cytochrome P450
MIALFAHPEQAELLRNDPDAVPGAVEEFLRYDPSVEYTTLRYAAEDLELGEQRLPRGSVVVVSLTSASRDAPMADGQDPDVLDVTRGARHLAFGHGIHYCLGAPLARLEATIALRTLLRRLPDLAPAIALEDVKWIPFGMMRGPVALPVRFTPQAPIG